MHPSPDACLDTLARLRAGALQGATRLELRHGGLRELPPELLALAGTLEVLDVSDNLLTQLPEGLARFGRLHTLFASGNRFTQLPPVLGRLPALDTLGFKANQIASVPAEALAPTLRWLILTDNRITALPATLARCTRMQKLMLAGNRLTQWPPGLAALQRLELVRLSANRFATLADALPIDLLALPRLAWLAHGDLYAHNILVDDDAHTCLLGDLGAASLLPVDDAVRDHALRALDWRAHAVLVTELAELAERAAR